MPDNKRLYFAITQVGIKGDGAASYNAIHGVQSVGMTTNFRLNKIQELGQLSPYEIQEDYPVIDVTLNRCLDGYPLAYHNATIDAPLPTLAGRSTSKCLVAIDYFKDTLDSATGTAASEVQVSGAVVTNLRFDLPLQGNMVEEIGLQGNNKMWANDPRNLAAAPWGGNSDSLQLNFPGAFTTNLDSPIGSGGVQRRQNLIFAYGGGFGLDANGMVADPDATILPPDIWGISNSGTNERISGNLFTAHIQDIRVSCTLNREDLLEQGHRGPYAKIVNFPVEVTTEVTITSVSGDMISATEQGILSASTALCTGNKNLSDRTIRLAICEGTRIYLGMKNKLQNVTNNGGDARGGNVTNTFTFITDNNFTVLHSGDPNSNGSTWWNSRATYLTN